MIAGFLAALQAAIAKKPGPDETPRQPDIETRDVEDTDPDAVEPVLPTLEIQKVGAWVGRSGFSNAKAIATTIKASKYLGLKRLDIIVNDDAEERDPKPFSTYDKGDIVNMALAAKAAGIDVHLMSWIMPHAGFIDGAALQLRELMRMTGALSVQWDAEEPWTQARKALKYEDAAKRIGLSFGGIPLGINGIGYCDARKFGPLAEVCDYLVPQAYATSTSGLKPSTVVPLLCRRWRSLFGRKKFVVGLAAYRQPPAGYTVESAMRAAFGGAEAEEDVEEVVYWSLGAIRSSARVTAVVRALTR